MAIREATGAAGETDQDRARQRRRSHIEHLHSPDRDQQPATDDIDANVDRSRT